MYLPLRDLTENKSDNNNNNNNSVQVIMEVKISDNTRINYTSDICYFLPDNVDSVYDAIEKVADNLEKFTERFPEGRATKSIIRVTRESEVRDFEITTSDFETTSKILDFMTN